MSVTFPDRLLDPDYYGHCWKWPGYERELDARPILNNRYVYRLIYEAVTGPVPDEVVLHHLCGNPWCVNPYHLSQETRADHLEEHRPLMRTTCRNGHVLGGDNLYLWRGKRYCRACHANNERKRRAAAAVIPEVSS